jgi:hypothetical protein
VYRILLAFEQPDPNFSDVWKIVDAGMIKAYGDAYGYDPVAGGRKKVKSSLQFDGKSSLLGKDLVDRFLSSLFQFLGEKIETHVVPHAHYPQSRQERTFTLSLPFHRPRPETPGSTE